MGKELLLGHVGELVDALLVGDLPAKELLVVSPDQVDVAAEDGGALAGLGAVPGERAFREDKNKLPLSGRGRAS